MKRPWDVDDQDRRTAMGRWEIDRFADLLKLFVTVSLGLIAAIGVWSRGEPNAWHLAAAIAAVVAVIAGLATISGLFFLDIEPGAAPPSRRHYLSMGWCLSIQLFTMAVSGLCMVVGFF